MDKWLLHNYLLGTVIRKMVVTPLFLHLGLTAFLLGLAISGSVNAAVEKSVTEDPALTGVSMIEPAPDYNCTSNGAFPHESECQYFYDCWNGEAYLAICTEMMLFDLRWSGCEVAQNVDCGDRNRPTNYPSTVTPPITRPTVDPSAPTTEASTIPPVNFTCPQPGGAFPHPARCDYYFVCFDSQPTLERCQLNWLFDLRYSGCNYPWLTECQDRERPPGYPQPSPTPSGGTTPETPPTEPTPPPGNFTCPQPGGAFPHPERCEYYYLCQENVPSLLQCENNYLFDLVYDGCNFPELTCCQDRERPPEYPGTCTWPSSTTTTPTPPTQPPVTDEDGSTISTTTTTQRPGFQCPEPNGLFPDPENCAAYYQCANGIPYHQFCPEPLYFDPNIKQCNFPDQVDCENRPTPIEAKMSYWKHL